MAPDRTAKSAILGADIRAGERLVKKGSGFLTRRSEDAHADPYGFNGRAVVGQDRFRA
jgi:hypothetical protein